MELINLCRFRIVRASLLLFLLITCPPLNAQNLIRFYDNYKVGYKDAQGKIVVPACYDAGGDFIEGRALVVFRGKRGFIDERGECVVMLQYEDAASFSEGLAAVKLKGKYGFVNKDGKIVIDHIYDEALSFSEGIARVRKGAAILFVNQKGEILMETSDLTVGQYRNGLIRKQNAQGLWGYINLSGEHVIEAQYKAATDFNYGKATVFTTTRCLVIDTNGKILSDEIRKTPELEWREQREYEEKHRVEQKKEVNNER